MIDAKSKLTVLHDDNGVFVNYSDQAADLTRDNFTVQHLSNSDDYLYIGYDKPFGSVYIHIINVANNDGTLALQYYNGTSWQALDLQDETLSLKRSGFLFWNRENMKATTVNSISKYYIRLRPSEAKNNVTFRGINLIFADDAALKEEFSQIDNTNMYSPGETSHILSHVAARNYIISALRNHYTKLNDSGSLEKINQYDLIDIFEIREAAVYLALSKIFFNLSDNPDDHWWLKYREYQDKYEAKMTLARLSIDENNDGLKDDSENLKQFKPVRWAR